MGMDEIPLAEFVTRRKINPYVNPRANFRGNDLFWTKQENLIYLDVIKAKQNIYVDVHWIDMHHMRDDRHRDYLVRLWISWSSLALSTRSHSIWIMTLRLWLSSLPRCNARIIRLQ